MESSLAPAGGIKGWGIDAEPANEPTYPIRKRLAQEPKSYTWTRPAQQVESKVEVLHSNERPNLSAVYGTSAPPSGLSGLLRREAFKHSESSYGHWLPLMVADRVNMVEGLFEDIFTGHLPNIFGELGWRAEWRHNRSHLIGRTLLRGVVVGALVAAVCAWADRRR